MIQPIVSLLALIAIGVSFASVEREKRAPRLDPCVLCKDETRIGCPTCAGRGTVDVPCPRCDGNGKGACERCTLEPEEAKALSEKRKLIDGLRARANADIPKEKRSKPGFIDCPINACAGGTLIWEDGKKNPCKVCEAKGNVRCVACQNGSRNCSLCSGSRKYAFPCWDCAGAGLIYCPLCKIQKPGRGCTWCAGAGERPCWLCQGSRHKPVPCSDCGGSGTDPCPQCFGIARMPCSNCSGCGKVRYKIVDSQSGAEATGGVRTCVPCSGRGFDTCERCKKGFVACKTCDGKKQEPYSCTSQAVCACVMRGPHAADEVLGRKLLEIGRKAEAIRFLEAAETRVDFKLPKSEECSPWLLKQLESARKVSKERIAQALATARSG